MEEETTEITLERGNDVDGGEEVVAAAEEDTASPAGIRTAPLANSCANTHNQDKQTNTHKKMRYPQSDMNFHIKPAFES